MAETIVIDGWECRAGREGCGLRIAHLGSALVMAAGGVLTLSVENNTRLPFAVARWLLDENDEVEPQPKRSAKR